VKKKKKPQLFDMIAILESYEESHLQTGDVGTVVELLPPDAVEVEFLDRDGRTRCIATLPISDVLVLNRERTVV
jgi:hypothetical protein